MYSINTETENCIHYNCFVTSSRFVADLIANTFLSNYYTDYERRISHSFIEIHRNRIRHLSGWRIMGITPYNYGKALSGPSVTVARLSGEIIAGYIHNFYIYSFNI